MKKGDIVHNLDIVNASKFRELCGFTIDEYNNKRKEWIKDGVIDKIVLKQGRSSLIDLPEFCKWARNLNKDK
jgi:hypothetical protein